MTRIAYLTQRVADKAADERRARRELVVALRKARAEGASLRALASQAQLSPEWVRRLTGPDGPSD